MFLQNGDKDEAAFCTITQGPENSSWKAQLCRGIHEEELVAFYEEIFLEDNDGDYFWLQIVMSMEQQQNDHGGHYSPQGSATVKIR